MTPALSLQQAASTLSWWLEAGWNTAIDPDARQFGAPRMMPQPAPARAKAVAPRSPHQEMAGVQDLAALRAYIDAFEGCPLKKTATNTVMADGLAGAPLMVIGEAPGADEDRSGLPFVGSAGQLLDRMLAAIGLDRKGQAPERAAYLSNIVFWRPLGNREPNSAEIAACLPITLRHIELARPRAILALGDISAKVLLSTQTSITRLRGRWARLLLNGAEYPVLPTYHPKFLLRKPAAKAQAWADLQMMKRFLDGAT